MNNNASSALHAISVSVEHSSGNIPPLLHEIRHALSQLLDTGVGTCIDLRSIPLASGEEERIVSALGSGEVRADLAALGSSEVAETGLAGVWLVSHFDENGEIQARFIEITFIPEILCSQRADIVDGLDRLTRRLGAA